MPAELEAKRKRILENLRSEYPDKPAGELESMSWAIVKSQDKKHKGMRRGKKK